MPLYDGGDGGSGGSGSSDGGGGGGSGGGDGGPAGRLCVGPCISLVCPQGERSGRCE